MANMAAVMTGIDVIEIQERPEPVAEPGKAVVAIQSVGVCGSDVAYLKHGRIGDYVVTGDIILGHEVAGEVIEVGPGVTNVKVGDRVAIEPGTPCRNCKECLHGRYHLCPDFVFLATPPYDGALVQRLAIDSRQLFAIPDSMSYEDGALIEPLSVGLWACKRANLQPGDRVLISGSGPVGLLAAEAARALGASAVTLTDVSDFRLGLASSHGFATERAGEPTDELFDVYIECSGVPGVFVQGLKRLDNAGRAAMVGLDKTDQTQLPLASLNPHELTIVQVNRYQFTWPVGIALVSSGRIDVEGLVTHEFSLGRTADALNLSSTVPNSMKAVIHPQKL
jgi:L-iditol 2-dehydrogenase